MILTLCQKRFAVVALELEINIFLPRRQILVTFACGLRYQTRIRSPPLSKPACDSSLNFCCWHHVTVPHKSEPSPNRHPSPLRILLARELRRLVFVAVDARDRTRHSGPSLAGDRLDLCTHAAAGE